MLDKAAIEQLTIRLGQLAELSDTIRKQHIVSKTIDDVFDRLAAQPQSESTPHLAGLSLAIQSGISGRLVEVRLNERMPYYREAMRIIRLLMKHAQTCNIKVLEENMLEQSGHLAPLIGLARVSASELELPKDIVLPRAIDPLNTGGSSIMSHVAIYALYDATLRVRYVGMSRNIDGRITTHRRRKDWLYGYEILEWAESDGWQERERYWIAFYRQVYQLENIARGGAGHPHTEQSRAKISAANKGRIKSPSEIANMMASRKRNGGWIWTEQARARIRMALLGRKHPESVKEKMRMSHAREDVKQKLRDALRGRIPWNKNKKTGHNVKHAEAIRLRWKQGAYSNRKVVKYWLGKKLSESIRANMRKAWVERKKKTLQLEEKKQCRT